MHHISHQSGGHLSQSQAAHFRFHPLSVAFSQTLSLGATGWTECDDFELPHRVNVQRTAATTANEFRQLAPLSDDVLLVSDIRNNPTWDSLSSSTAFNYTLGTRHTVVRSGCENANRVYGKELATLLPQEVFIVSQSQFDSNNFSIPVAQQAYVSDIRMIARPFARANGADASATKLLFSAIVLPKLLHMFVPLNTSVKLRIVILRAFQKAFGAGFCFVVIHCSVGTTCFRCQVE